MRLEKIFGKIDADTSLDSYVEFVSNLADGSVNVSVAGPQDYDNNVCLNPEQFRDFLESFKDRGVVQENFYTELVGQSVSAYYRGIHLVGVQRKG